MSRYIQKNCSEWYKDIKSPFLRESALKNLLIDRKVNSIGDAIDKGFTWANTPEGDRFWSKINNFYIKKRYEIDNDFFGKKFKYKSSGELIEIFSISRKNLLVNKTKIHLLVTNSRLILEYDFPIFREKIKSGEIVEQEENKGNV